MTIENFVWTWCDDSYFYPAKYVQKTEKGQQVMLLRDRFVIEVADHLVYPLELTVGMELYVIKRKKALLGTVLAIREGLEEGEEKMEKVVKKRRGRKKKKKDEDDDEEEEHEESEDEFLKYDDEVKENQEIEIKENQIKDQELKIENQIDNEKIEIFNDEKLLTLDIGFVDGMLPQQRNVPLINICGDFFSLPLLKFVPSLPIGTIAWARYRDGNYYHCVIVDDEKVVFYDGQVFGMNKVLTKNVKVLPGALMNVEYSQGEEKRTRDAKVVKEFNSMAYVVEAPNMKRKTGKEEPEKIEWLVHISQISFDDEQLHQNMKNETIK